MCIDSPLFCWDVVKVDLGYVAIRAPISGIVSSVSTQEGETVAASFTAPTFVTIIGDNALQLGQPFLGSTPPPGCSLVSSRTALVFMSIN